MYHIVLLASACAPASTPWYNTIASTKYELAVYIDNIHYFSVMNVAHGIHNQERCHFHHYKHQYNTHIDPL